MTMANNRELIDRLGRMTTEERAEINRAGRIGAAMGNPLGLKFAEGARVLDVATGLRGTVRVPRLAPKGSGGLYNVVLDDGRLVYRVDTELEADSTPAPVQP